MKVYVIKIFMEFFSLRIKEELLKFEEIAW